MMLLYMHIPVTSTIKPINCKAWNSCHFTNGRSETVQITSVRTESKTILVVADISLVTEIPAKLKKAIDIWKKIHMYDIISHAL